MREFIVTVRVLIDDANIETKYPNFRYNFENSEAGLEEFARRFVHEEDALVDFGFSVEIVGVVYTD